MSALRFNHMELTLPPGALERDRDAIVTFYSEVFGFNAIEVPLFDAAGLMLATDDEVSQFLRGDLSCIILFFVDTCVKPTPNN